MSEDNLDHIFTGEPQPEPELDLPTIHDFRKRIYGRIFARQVQILQAEAPSFRWDKPETDEKLMKAVGELEEARQHHKNQRLKRDGALESFWEIMGIIDDMENEAIKGLEQGEDIDI